MDWEHEYYQNSSNTNRRPNKAFYLDVLQNGMGEYSREEVAECISAYHAAEDDPPSPATLVASDEPREHHEEHQDMHAVGGSNWFNDVSPRYYSDSEMEFVTQYYHAAEENIEPTKSDDPDGARYQLGEEERDERNGSRKVLPPRNLSEVSRPQVTRDAPVPVYIDEVATSRHPKPAKQEMPAELPVGKLGLPEA